MYTEASRNRSSNRRTTSISCFAGSVGAEGHDTVDRRSSSSYRTSRGNCFPQKGTSVALALDPVAMTSCLNNYVTPATGGGGFRWHHLCRSYVASVYYSQPLHLVVRTFELGGLYQASWSRCPTTGVWVLPKTDRWTTFSAQPAKLRAAASSHRIGTGNTSALRLQGDFS
jgi:hypothetical protein